jgi:UDP-N-acetylmuramoyl-L-alanyl-D-glutamate--2,6-diaminopimelate ligase
MNHAAMSLAELFAGMDMAVPEVAIADIALDSRRVVPGGLFLACAGASGHGLDYLQQALSAGAVAVAFEPVHGRAAPALPAGVTGLPVPGLRARLGVVADRFFRAPSADLAVTGITGTNGKTTTAWLVSQALAAIGSRAAYLGTLGYGFPPALAPTVLTTPDCVELHRRLRELAAQGARHVIAEVSSHALDQGRVSGVRFAVAALTNLSRDHLDYHRDLEAYAAAKARLFTDTGVRRAVINVGDAFGATLAGRLPAGTELITVALVDTAAAMSGVRLLGRLTAAHGDGTGLRLAGDFGNAVLQSPLWGRFNAENLVVAAGILLSHGLSLPEVTDALGRAAAPPGRMEVIRADGGRPIVIVDFAHTPAALEAALGAVREHCSGKVWCVFGCGGDRDRGKRGAMGAAAAAGADYVIVTDDNPRSESPAAIAADVLAGAGDSAAIEIIHDRAAAIRRALTAAGPGDVVLIAGKGHEATQTRGADMRPFSDARVARAELGLAE